MDNGNFDAIDYWLRRLRGTGDLTEVGHRSLGPDYNRHIYARREDVLGRLKEDLGLEPAEVQVLDLGCGHGFYVDFWRRCGVRQLTGIDIATTAIARLRREYPEYRFLQADVTIPFNDLLSDTRFEVITAFDLVYHILADEGLAVLFRTISSLLTDDGYFIWTDRMPRRDYAFTPHVRYRAYGHVARILDASGLALVQAQPLFLTLEPPVTGWIPIDLTIAAAYRATGGAMRRVPTIGDRLGRLAALIDRSVVPRLHRTPNHYLLVARRRGCAPTT